MKKLYVGLVLLVLLVLLGIGYFVSSQVPLGSVSATNEYNSTTTNGYITTAKQLAIGQGTLGQVTITGVATGRFDLLDATTTDITKRTGNIATSSLYLASFADSQAVGTYVFDSIFTRGLLYDQSGTQGTSTIGWRQ